MAQVVAYTKRKTKIDKEWKQINKEYLQCQHQQNIVDNNLALTTKKLKVTSSEFYTLFDERLVRITTRIKKKNAPLYLWIKQIKNIILTISS